MSYLQLGLALLGVAVVVAVVVYNRRQERKARRAAEQALAPRGGDALMDAARPRREAVLLKNEYAPDARIDYVIELQGAVAPALVHEVWQSVEQRFGRRALLAAAGSGWRAGLQMVSREGVVSDAELVEFRSAVETMASALGAAVAAPEMRQALEGARQIDRLCEDSDIQVALHVIGAGIEPAAGEQPFRVTRREDGITLALDAALTPDLGRSYEAMARAAHSLAQAHGGRVVDDRGNALDERGLASIGAQIEAVRQNLVAHGIEPGSALAQRLFS